MIEKFLKYNHDINLKMIEKCTLQQEQLNKKTLRLFSHILNAHQIWNSRILDKTKEIFDVFELHPINEWANINESNYHVTQSILQYENIATYSISYSNSKGEKYENTVEDILLHICNHSNYHRAQINSELVKLKIDPVLSDYIFYRRD